LDIIEIFPDTDRNFKLLTLKRGLIVLTYPELTPTMAKTYGQYDLTPEIYEEYGQKPKANDIVDVLNAKQVKDLVANSEHGFVFGSLKKGGDEDDDKLTLELNVYGSSVSNKSRSLATF
jgi:hypothetical protein